jgi:hypothetical protein
LFLQSFAIFVDHNDGYPWIEGKFLAWTLPQTSDRYHLAMYGFPYYRHWREVGEYMQKEGRSRYFMSNEKADISVFYVPLERDEAKVGYYAFVRGPQNFTEDIGDRRIREWVLSHQPFANFSNGSQVVTSLYFLPEPRAAK